MPEPRPCPALSDPTLCVHGCHTNATVALACAGVSLSGKLTYVFDSAITRRDPNACDSSGLIGGTPNAGVDFASCTAASTGANCVPTWFLADGSCLSVTHRVASLIDQGSRSIRLRECQEIRSNRNLTQRAVRARIAVRAPGFLH